MASDWTLTPDGQYYQAEGKLLLPVDSNGVAIVQLRPEGGIGSGFSAVEKGEPGVHAELDETVNVTELEHDDPTPAGGSFTTLVPPTTSTPGVYQLNLAVRKGEPGDDGESVWDPTDLSESPVAGQIPVVNGDTDGFVLAAQRIPEVFYPGAVNNTASGNANSTLAMVSIAARPWARRIRPFGHTVVTGEAPDVRVDLIARLNGESGGNIVGRCPGIAQTERLQFSPGKAAGTADLYDVIDANESAVVYIRCERQAGATTYTTTASTSLFSVEALPL